MANKLPSLPTLPNYISIEPVLSELNPSQEPSNGAARLAGSFFGTVFAAVSLVLITIFAFSLYGRHFFVAELLSNFRAQILVALVIFTAGAICFQRWWIGFLLVIATIWCSTGVLSVYLQIDQPPPGKNKIRIMSHNVLADNRSYAATKKQFAEINPDVLVVVEYDHQWHVELQSMIDDGTYPYSLLAPRWHGFGIAILSKLPLTNKQTFQLTPDITDAPMVMAEFMVGQQNFRVAGLHVFSPTTTVRMNLRNQQIAEAVDILKKSKTPTVVMGDFNCTPWSPFLDDFLKDSGYRDSRGGFGYQGTWCARYRWPALIPIDHAFVSPTVHVHDRFVGDNTGSDH